MLFEYNWYKSTSPLHTLTSLTYGTSTNTSETNVFINVIELNNKVSKISHSSNYLFIYLLQHRSLCYGYVGVVLIVIA